MLIIDPLGAVVSLFEVFKKSKRARAWASLLFSMAFSGLIGFLGGMGAALVAGEGFLFSLGSGLLVAAGSLLSLFLASPLTRGMMISVPKQVVEAHQEGDDQVKITHR